MKFDSNLAWKQATASVSANREVLLALAGVFFLLPSLAFALLLPAPEAVTGQSEAQAMAAMQGYYGAAMPYFIPMMLIQAAGTLALLTLFTDTSRPTVGVAIRQGFVGMIPYFAAQLLLGIGIAVLAVAVLGLGSVAGVPAITVVAVAIVVLAVVYAYIKTSLVGPIIAVEQQRNPVAALRRSWRLTKGNSVRIGLFYLLLAIAFLVVFGVVTMVIGLLAGLAGGETAKIVNAIVSSAVTALMTLYFVATLAAVHRQLAGPSPEASRAPFD